VVPKCQKGMKLKRTRSDTSSKIASRAQDTLCRKESTTDAPVRVATEYLALQRLMTINKSSVPRLCDLRGPKGPNTHGSERLGGTLTCACVTINMRRHYRCLPRTTAAVMR